MKRIIFAILIILIGVTAYFYFTKEEIQQEVIKEDIPVIDKTDYEEYKIGDIIKINDDDWYVIKESHNTMDYVTVININHDRKIKNCYNKYISLNEKKYFEGEYLKNIGENKTKEVDGYRIRLITLEEFQNLATLTEINLKNDQFNYKIKTPYEWVKSINTLTMTDVDYYDEALNKEGLCRSWYIQGNIRQIFGMKQGFIPIQPVINLFKENI